MIRKRRHNRSMRKGMHMGQSLENKMMLLNPLLPLHCVLLLHLQQTEEKRDLQQLLLVLASTTSLELAQGINQHLRVFFKEKQLRRRQICAWQDGFLMHLFHLMQVIPFFTSP
jgi:hypothetical protein